jgi:hypothetical protein
MDGWMDGDLATAWGFRSEMGTVKENCMGCGPLRRCLVASLSGAALGWEGWPRVACGRVVIYGSCPLDSSWGAVCGLWCVRVLNCVGLVDRNTFFACWAATSKLGVVVRTLV